MVGNSELDTPISQNLIGGWHNGYSLVQSCGILYPYVVSHRLALRQLNSSVSGLVTQSSPLLSASNVVSTKLLMPGAILNKSFQNLEFLLIITIHKYVLLLYNLFIKRKLYF